MPELLRRVGGLCHAVILERHDCAKSDADNVENVDVERLQNVDDGKKEREENGNAGIGEVECTARPTKKSRANADYDLKLMFSKTETQIPAPVQFVETKTQSPGPVDASQADFE